MSYYGAVLQLLSIFIFYSLLISYGLFYNIFSKVFVVIPIYILYQSFFKKRT